jgi:hypothetical protein
MMSEQSAPKQPNLTNVQNAPTIAQPAPSGGAATIRFNKDYLVTIGAFLRIAIIVFQFCGWVSAAAVKNGDLSEPYQASRG